MPAGISGTSKKFAYSLANLSGVYQPASPSEIVDFSVPDTVIAASQPLTSQTTPTYAIIAKTEIASGIPTHMSQSLQWTVVFSWTDLILWGWGDSIEWTDRSASAPPYGVPASFSVNDVSPYTSLAEWFVEIRTGSVQGTRQAAAGVADATVTYSEYIPDLRGGEYRPVPSLFPVVNSLVTVDAEGVMTFPAGWYYLSTGRGAEYEEAFLDNTAEYSLDGTSFTQGCVVKITLVDYEWADEPPENYVLPQIQISFESYDWIPTGVSHKTSIFCHPVAEPYGRDTYIAVPTPTYLEDIRVISEGLRWYKLQMSIYSSLTPPEPARFWSKFVGTVEIP